ncbi:MAG TPA: hypothetical protein VK658_26750 [Chryseolinea sp.]|nr:hypothetical protein [Chryseolinea sp.]
MMVVFSFFGLIGFVYLYMFLKENIKFRHTILGYDLVTVIIFLPNLHFWSNSLGKGSVIFAGIGLFFYGISNLRTRWLHTLIGGIIIYHVRPHILLVVLVSAAVGFMFSTKGVSVFLRAIFLVGASIAFFFIYKDVLTLVGIDEGEFVADGMNLSHRASELSKATSGIDISNYSLPEQVFAFLYRPLFFDSPGLLGIIVSFENVFYLFMTIRLFSMNGLKFLFTGSFLVKAAFLSFLTVTVALAQVSGNLGLAMRQKSQVMVLFMFVVIAFLDNQKMRAYQQGLRRQRRLAKFNDGVIGRRASESAQQ